MQATLEKPDALEEQPATGPGANAAWMSAQASDRAPPAAPPRAPVPALRAPPANPEAPPPASRVQESALVASLTEDGQSHLFAPWPPAGERDEDKRRLLTQLAHLDSSYAGGLTQYVANARRLLADSQKGARVGGWPGGQGFRRGGGVGAFC
jgi:hypothetical protein